MTKRTLTPEEYRIFNYHFLLGADWKLCCRKLKMEKGIFFHTLYRIMVKLGATTSTCSPMVCIRSTNISTALAPEPRSSRSAPAQNVRSVSLSPFAKPPDDTRPQHTEEPWSAPLHLGRSQ